MKALRIVMLASLLLWVLYLLAVALTPTGGGTGPAPYPR